MKTQTKSIFNPSNAHGTMFVGAFCIETNEWFLKEYSTVSEGEALLEEATTKYDFNSDLIEAVNFEHAKTFLFQMIRRKGYTPGEQMEVL